MMTEVVTSQDQSGLRYRIVVDEIGKYHIQIPRSGGKWRMLRGGFTRQKAFHLIKERGVSGVQQMNRNEKFGFVIFLLVMTVIMILLR